MGYGTLVTSSYPPLQSMGAVSLVSVVTLVVASVLVLPALLTLVGHRLRSRAAGVDGHGFARLAGVIQRRALPVVVVVGAGLAVLAVPFFGARFEDIGVHALPTDSESRQVAEALDAWFPGRSAPGCTCVS